GPERFHELRLPLVRDLRVRLSGAQAAAGGDRDRGASARCADARADHAAGAGRDVRGSASVSSARGRLLYAPPWTNVGAFATAVAGKTWVRSLCAALESRWRRGSGASRGPRSTPIDTCTACYRGGTAPTSNDRIIRHGHTLEGLLGDRPRSARC